MCRQRQQGLLSRFGVPNAQDYGTHDLRRGHAEDMRNQGCTLAEILKAGQWKSAAFMSYLDEAGMEKVRSFESMCDLPVNTRAVLSRIWRLKSPCKAKKNGLTSFATA